MNIVNNLKQIKKEILCLEKKYHRAPESVRLLAVSKTKSALDIETMIHAGQTAFGENYVQEAIEKIQALKKYSVLEWHYIGRIQKNKIKLLAQYFDWIQTIDHKDVAKKLNTACEKLNKKMNICIQVNISHESQKNGISIQEISTLSKYIVETCPYLCLRGLMTIGLATQDESALKAMFHPLQYCYDELKNHYKSIDTLSMGMSHDMTTAIECGSTMVRIGTAIFGIRNNENCLSQS